MARSVQTDAAPTVREWQRSESTLGLHKWHSSYDDSDDEYNSDDDSPELDLPLRHKNAPREDFSAELRMLMRLRVHAATFYESRLLRARFPLDSVVGIRLMAQAGCVKKR